MTKSIKAFKVIGVFEAISYLLLLGIAMPLKYIWDKPEMVSSVGMAHGVLFIAYVAMAVYISTVLKWNAKTLFIVILCSMLPFGPFYADKKYLP